MRPLKPFTLLLSALFVGSFVSPMWAGAPAAYLYNLSDFSGTIPYSDVKLHADDQRGEIYAALGNSVRIFNTSGMEVYRFDVDPHIGGVYDLAIEPSGDILLLTVKSISGQKLPHWEVTRCDYRGEPAGTLGITGLPDDLDAFVPNLMAYQRNSLYLASSSGLRVVVADTTGAFLKSFDLAALVGVPDSRRADNDLFGFSVDSRGNILFTMATLAKAFVLSPDGNLTPFGKAGSIPGSFGITSGIAADDSGHIFVADKLRGVVIVFDQNLQFVSEFGDGTDGRISLVSPRDLAYDDSGKVYVTQGRNMGVAVFKLALEPAPAVGSSSETLESPDKGGSAKESRNDTGRRTARPAGQS